MEENKPKKSRKTRVRKETSNTDTTSELLNPETHTSTQKFKLDWQGNLELIPILFGVITVLGTVYINSYYFFGFNFKISSFVDISEILLISFVDVGSMADLLPIFVVFLLLMLRAFTLPILRNVFSNRYFSAFSSISIPLFPALILYFIAPLNGWVLYLLILLMAISVCLIIISELSHYNPIYSKTGVLLWLIIFFIFISQNHYKEVVNKHYTYGTKIVTEKDTLISDSLFYYVGKTKNYAFMWSARDTAMTVIPMSDIKKLVIHNTLPDKKPTPKPKNKKVLPSMAIKNDSSKTLKK